MDERCETAEKILMFAKEAQRYINNVDKKFERVVFECGPSGYVGCSHECRGQGLRRRSGCMEDISNYLLRLGQNKDQMILLIRPVILAFENMSRTRSGHVIYYRCGKCLTVQQYADRFGYSRRHARRLYIKAMLDLYNNISRFDGKELISKFDGHEKKQMINCQNSGTM